MRIIVVLGLALGGCGGAGEHRSEPVDETYTTGDDVPVDDPTAEPEPVEGEPEPDAQ